MEKRIILVAVGADRADTPPNIVRIVVEDMPGFVFLDKLRLVVELGMPAEEINKLYLSRLTETETAKLRQLAEDPEVIALADKVLNMHSAEAYLAARKLSEKMTGISPEEYIEILRSSMKDMAFESDLN